MNEAFDAEAFDAGKLLMLRSICCWEAFGAGKLLVLGSFWCWEAILILTRSHLQTHFSVSQLNLNFEFTAFF